MINILSMPEMQFSIQEGVAGLYYTTMKRAIHSLPQAAYCLLYRSPAVVF
jgi:uncharacterized protein (DUF2252 family)